MNPEGVVYKQPPGDTEQGRKDREQWRMDPEGHGESHLHLPSFSYLDNMLARAAAVPFWWEVGEKLDIRYCGRSAWEYVWQNLRLQGNP